MRNRPSGSRQRILLGLIGAPIAHSASPAMHEAAAAALDLDARYHLIEVAGADKKRLRAMLEGVRALSFAGVNITYPYKEAVVPLLDDLSPQAAAMRAVNTVVVKDGRLIGHNTDATGFRRLVAEQQLPIDKDPTVLIGAGGVGRAMGFALADAGAAEIRIIDIDPAKARKLARDLPAGARATAFATVEQAMEGATGVVNGTPVGMSPNKDTPVPAHLIRPHHWVADAVYSPLWTPLLKAAHARGARVATGRELAIAQAIDAFQLFTGLEPSPIALSAAFDRVIAARGTDPLAA